MVSLLAVSTCGLAGETDVAERPNLVLIFTDDQRCDAIGYAGNDAIQTPNLDQLHNLAENPEYAKLFEQLRQRCEQLAAEVGPVQ